MQLALLAVLMWGTPRPVSGYGPESWASATLWRLPWCQRPAQAAMAHRDTSVSRAGCGWPASFARSPKSRRSGSDRPPITPSPPRPIVPTRRPRPRRIVRPAPDVIEVAGFHQRAIPLLPARRRDVQALARLQVTPRRDYMHVNAARRLSVPHRRTGVAIRRQTGLAARGRKGLIVNRESCVCIGMSPDHPTTNRVDHGARGSRSAIYVPSTRSGGRSAPPPAPTRGPGGSAACRRPSGAA